MEQVCCGGLTSVRFFKDGFKIKERIGFALFSPDLNSKLSHRLPDHCRILQAKITAIHEVVISLQNNIEKDMYLHR